VRDRPEYRAQVHADACAARLAKESLPKKAAKDDCLQREQLPAWFEQVRRIHNPVIAAYLQTALLTGAPGGAGRAPLGGRGFSVEVLTIKDKVEGERTIPLTPYVAALLASLPRRNEWVFSSPTAETGRLQEPRIAHNKALAAAGLPALSLHGLRRSFGTLAEWVECPPASARRSWGTSRPPPPRSTIAAGPGSAAPVAHQD
jgi:integrase